jgi:hypothetical protein
MAPGDASGRIGDLDGTRSTGLIERLLCLLPLGKLMPFIPMATALLRTSASGVAAGLSNAKLATRPYARGSKAIASGGRT